MQHAKTDIQIYVDDPLVLAAGSLDARDRSFGKTLLVLGILRLKMSWGKAYLGVKPSWIGACIWASREFLHISVTEQKRAQMVTTLEALLGAPTAPIRELQKVAGSSSFVAGFIVYWKPFVAMIYAAIAATVRESTASHADDHRAGRATLHVSIKRCRHALVWLLAFLVDWSGCERKFRITPTITIQGNFICMDASPWGMGAALYINFVPVEFFGVELSDQDLRRYSAKKGVSDHITIWEALTFLVCVRVWLVSSSIPQVIRLKSDSLGALRAMMKLSSPNKFLNYIAMEVAHHVAVEDVDTSCLEHIPGVSNVVADSLSRLYAPSPKSVPECLANSKRIHPPERTPEFYRVWNRRPSHI